LAARGEVWLVDLDPSRGHEQAGRRPALIVSTDRFNLGRAGLVIAVPMTTRDRGIVLHVRVDPPEGGVGDPSFIKCEDVRSISAERLLRRLGVVGRGTLDRVGFRLRTLLEL
jgi:mRNA interferase MazF